MHTCPPGLTTHVIACTVQGFQYVLVLHSYEGCCLRIAWSLDYSILNCALATGTKMWVECTKLSRYATFFVLLLPQSQYKVA